MTDDHQIIRHGDEDIVRLDPMEHIRKRPSMYVGGTDEKALHHLIYEIIGNAIDLAFAGQCDHIWVTLRDDNEVCIRHNGQGFSPVVNPFGYSELQMVMTEVGMCGRHIQQPEEYYVSGGYHGVGLSAVNGLSSWMRAEVAYKGYLWRQEYREGRVQDQVAQIRPLTAEDSSGNTFTFQPDYTIFDPYPFKVEQIEQRLREISYLMIGLQITLTDERDGKNRTNTFHSTRGLTEYVERLNGHATTLHEPIYQKFKVSLPRKTHEPFILKVDFAFQITNKRESLIKIFMNTLEMPNSVEHIQAFSSTLTNVINASDQYRDDEQEFLVDEATCGLTLVMHILHPNPNFRSFMTLDNIIEPELYGAICEAAYRAGTQLFSDRNAARELVENCEKNRYLLKGGIC